MNKIHIVACLSVLSNFNRQKTGGLSFSKEVLSAIEAGGRNLETRRPANLLNQ